MLDRPRYIVEDLRKAIDDHAIEVHYQPQVKADGYTVAGVEALVRLRLADGTLLQPDEFVSKLDANVDAATILGDHVLEQACSDARN